MNEHDITSGTAQVQLNEKLYHVSIFTSYPEGEMVQRHIITSLHCHLLSDYCIFKIHQPMKYDGKCLMWSCLENSYRKKQMRNLTVQTLKEFSGLKLLKERVSILPASWRVLTFKMSPKLSPWYFLLPYIFLLHHYVILLLLLLSLFVCLVSRTSELQNLPQNTRRNYTPCAPHTGLSWRGCLGCPEI